MGATTPTMTKLREHRTMNNQTDKLTNTLMDIIRKERKNGTTAMSKDNLIQGHWHTLRDFYPSGTNAKYVFTERLNDTIGANKVLRHFFRL